MSGSTTLQRAGSFGRRSSWQLDPAMLGDIPFLEQTDVDRMAPFCMPVGQIVAGEGAGDVSALERLTGEVEHLQEQYGQNLLLPLAAAKVSRRVGTALKSLARTDAVMDQVPLQPVRDILNAIETIACGVEKADARRRRAAAEYASCRPQPELPAAAEVPASREPAGLLPGSLTDADGFREGWKEDEWWRAAGRRQTVEALEALWQSWLQADEQTAALYDTRACLKDAIVAVEDQLQTVNDVQVLRGCQPPQSTDMVEAYEAALRELTGRRDAAVQDVRVVEQLQRDLRKRNAEASATYKRSAEYLQQFQAVCRRRREEAERQVEELDDWLQKEAFHIEEAGEPHSDVIDPLQEEVRRLRQELQEKEETLEREIDLWRQAHGESARRKMQQMKQQFDQKCAAEQSRRTAVRELLVDECGKAADEAKRRALREAERREEVEAVLARLRGRQAALERTAKAYTDLAMVTEMSRELWQELHRVVGQFFDTHLIDETDAVRQLHMTGLADGGQLHALLGTISTTLNDRLTAANKVSQQLNTLLEFNVDTYDPYAHRIHTVLDNVHDMRRRLQTELSENAQAVVWLKGHIGPMLKATVADKWAPAGPLKLLRTKHPGLFAMLSEEKPAEASVVELATTPRSLYISPRKPVPSSPGRDSSPTSGGASPLPWVQTRHWQIPDDAQLAMENGAGNLGATWPTTQPSSLYSPHRGNPTLSGSLRFVPPATSTSHFDHRDFHLRRTLR